MAGDSRTTAAPGRVRRLYRRWRGMAWWKRWLVQLHVLAIVLALTGLETVRRSRIAIDSSLYPKGMLNRVAGSWRGFSVEGADLIVWFDTVYVFCDPRNGEELQRFAGGLVGWSPTNRKLTVGPSTKEETARVVRELDAGWAKVRERMISERQARTTDEYEHEYEYELFPSVTLW